MKPARLWGWVVTKIDVVAIGYGYSIEVRAYGHKHCPENREWDVRANDLAKHGPYNVGSGSTALEVIYAWKWLHGRPLHVRYGFSPSHYGGRPCTT